MRGLGLGLLLGVPFYQGGNVQVWSVLFPVFICKMLCVVYCSYVLFCAAVCRMCMYHFLLPYVGCVSAT